MDKLAGLISSVELLIRHLLSGIAIYAIFFFSLCDTSSQLRWIEEQPMFVALAVSALGFVAYSIYRITFWVIGDGIAWLCRCSAPAHLREQSWASHRAYAEIFRWRRTKGFDKKLSGYLHYRWAVVHFTFIFALALWFASFYSEPHSIIRAWPVAVKILASISSVVAIWQSSFLFRVELELFKHEKCGTAKDGVKAEESVGRE